MLHFTGINAKLSLLPTWKNITKKKEPLADAEDWKDVQDKLQYLDQNNSEK